MKSQEHPRNTKLQGDRIKLNSPQVNFGLKSAPVLQVEARLLQSSVVRIFSSCLKRVAIWRQVYSHSLVWGYNLHFGNLNCFPWKECFSNKVAGQLFQIIVIF